MFDILMSPVYSPILLKWLFKIGYQSIVFFCTASRLFEVLKVVYVDTFSNSTFFHLSHFYHIIFELTLCCTQRFLRQLKNGLNSWPYHFSKYMNKIPIYLAEQKVYVFSAKAFSKRRIFFNCFSQVFNRFPRINRVCLS